jgi:DNA-binding GntR family transcriptional regulator
VPKVRRETVADQSLSILRSQILDGDLRPGDAVTEDAMAREIGVSRPTMREVLKTLVGEGLLTRHPSTRILQVTTLTADEVNEIYTARRILETAGIDAARNASDDELARLEDTIREMSEAVADNDLYALVQADSRCHAETVAFTRSRYLCTLHEQLMSKLNLTLSQVESEQPGDNVELLRQHQEYCALVVAGETEAAKAQLLSRLDAAEELVLEGLQKQETVGRPQRRSLLRG